ncbi:hypothetical protein H8356DRAFT_1702294 [Neocallimastix lanati (nom. inval.)]|nr:hypothetical protein H8356DRAFT_1702294 [Neocallimastix sp. JGI-2020a]
MISLIFFSDSFLIFFYKLFINSTNIMKKKITSIIYFNYIIKSFLFFFFVLFFVFN